MRVETFPKPTPNPALHYLVNGNTAHRIRHNGNTLCRNLNYPDAYLTLRVRWDEKDWPVCKHCAKTGD